MANKPQQQVTLLSDTSVGNIFQGVRDSFSGIVDRSRISAIINFQKESALARQIIGKDARLQQCTEVSISNAFMNVAFTGLSLNPVKQHATFIARWNYDQKRYEAQLLIMYRGLMWLAGQAGVTDISVDVVYTGDKISISKSDEGDKFEHTIAVGLNRDGISNKFMGAYVAAKMPGSRLRKVEWVPAEDIYMARGKSDSYLKDGEPNPKSPWVWTFDEMAKKVAIKRAQKRWEEAVVENDEWKRFQTAVALDNVVEGVIPSKASDIPGTAEHLLTGDKHPTEATKLDMKQLAEIEKLVEQVAPNRPDATGNVSNYMSKIARTYRANSLSEVDASKFTEIKDRINEAIKIQKAKAAAGAQATDKAKAGEGGKVAGKQQDGPAKGAAEKDKGTVASGTRVAGGSGPGGSAGSENREQGNPAREPGSDDDRGDPEDSTRTPGPDNGR